ncbi:hypothetical protein K490DRAFT_75036 [Saccharata proteae CBS 121410]|uniref:PWWP domain-containing protein n=1 Tax=Saccharata proteae CBS 121410 TaxID=1314787 RepID=A0A9P4HS21_9PEZI|nr:hypothetical protein K490DRAFT_75036 [Saccharata proteae CBS 121410]
MAEQSAPAAPETSTKPDEASAPSVEVKATPADATTDDDKPAADEPAPTTSAPTTSDPPATSDTAKADTSEKSDMAPPTEATPSTPAPATPVNGASSKKKGGRKSIGGASGDKSAKKGKQSLVMHLDVEPGQYWFGRMKGYPDWPVITCKDDMLPESLLVKRPVSAARADGSYREDFRDDGKHAKDRRYPVMFLGTNEFAWVVNTDLTELNMANIKEIVKNEDRGKKSKALWEAYKVAAEEHPISHFQTLVREHEKAMEDDRIKEEAEQAEKEAKQTKKAQKGPQKGKRKSTAGADEDLEMEDVSGEGAAPPKKTHKKRKASDSDTEEKVTEESATKPKKTPAAKPKKNAKKVNSEEESTPQADAKPMSEAEVKEKREKAILYLRHRLQKGFLTRDQAPREDEMQQMSEYLAQLEQYTDLEVAIIKNTKINKVLKAIIKLNSIPKDEIHQFKKRSTDLLSVWNNAIAAEPASEANGHKEEAKSPVAEGESKTEDIKAEEPKTEEDQESKAEEAPKTDAAAADETKDVEMKDETPAEPVETSGSPGDKAGDEGDVAMEDAKPTEPAAADDEKEGDREGDKEAAAPAESTEAAA